MSCASQRAVTEKRYRLHGRSKRRQTGEITDGQVDGELGFRKQVTVKRLRSRTADHVQLFKAEVRIASLLNHPNIIQVHDVANMGGDYSIVMERVQGLTVAEAIRCLKSRGGSMRVSLAASIAAEVASALDYAHSLRDEDGTPLQLVHRNVTPDSIVLGRNGEVKLGDFAIVKYRGAQEITQVGWRRGRIAYMPPEYLSERALTPSVDIYMLGAVLSEMLTLTPCVDAESPTVAAQSVLKGQLQTARTLRPAIPETLLAIVDAAVALQPNRRFRSARDFSRALRMYLATAGGAENWDPRAALGAFVRSMEAPKPPADKADRAIRTAREQESPRAPSDPFDAADARFEAESVPDARAHRRATGGHSSRRPRGAKHQPSRTVNKATRPFEERARRPKNDWTSGLGRWVAFSAALVLVAAGLGYLESRQGKATDWFRDASSSSDIRAPSGASAARGSSGDSRSRSADQATGPKLESEEPTAPNPTRYSESRGWLSLVSEPPTRVSMGGVVLGTTPLENVELPAGAHTLILRNQRLGLNKRVTVDVTDSRHSRRKLTFSRGKVEVEAPAGFALYVGRRLVGTTPLNGDFELYEGMHRIRAVKKESEISMVARVKVKPDQIAKVTFAEPAEFLMPQ